MDACAKEGGTLRTRSVPCFLSKAAASKTRKAENPGFPKHESLMTCIARPPVSSMGYWATNTSVERRVCVVDERRRMSGASRTTEATWNDKKSSIIMLAGGDAHLVPQGQAASPPRPPKPQALKPASPQAPIPKRPSPRVPKVAKPPSSQAPKPLSACPPSAQFSNFQIIRSASARPQIPRKRPSS